MPTCRKCEKSFPFLIKVDGKKRNLKSRRYCLDCSPFGKHNTKNLEVTNEPEKPCKICELDRKKQKGRTVCYVCINKRREKKKLDQLHGVVGNACWICKYEKGSKGRKVLDFHHMNPAEKDFELNTRNVGQLAWERILEEAKKCVLLCCRCHREFHSGLISSRKMERLHVKRWEKLGQLD